MPRSCRPRRKPFPVRPSVAIALAILASGCASDKEPATTGSGASAGGAPTTEPATTDAPVTTVASNAVWNGVDLGPTAEEMDDVLAAIGQVSPAGDACPGLPYTRNELLVYLSPKGHNEISDIAPNLVNLLAPLGMTLDAESIFTDSTAALGTGGPIFVLPTQQSPTIDEIIQVNDALQPFGGDVVVDVNHIGPFLPIGTFHPDGDPVEATTEEPDGEHADGTHSVLVIDSPDADDPEVAPTTASTVSGSPTVDYDGWGEAWSTRNDAPDGKVDFVAGHGPFVTDIIRRAAPAADVISSAVLHSAKSSTPWPPFLFTELDLIAALERGLGSDGGTATTPRAFAHHVDVINFSLGLFGCEADPHPALAGELNDILAAGNYANGVDTMTLFVAAAGNDGSEQLHYPAAFADDRNGPTALSDHTVAVGALADGGAPVRACTSNFGRFVTAWAAGTAVAVFPPAWPGATGLASWSGTSFATARVSGALADAAGAAADEWQTAEQQEGRIGASDAFASTSVTAPSSTECPTQP